MKNMTLAALAAFVTIAGCGILDIEPPESSYFGGVVVVESQTTAVEGFARWVSVTTNNEELAEFEFLGRDPNAVGDSRVYVARVNIRDFGIGTFTIEPPSDDALVFGELIFQDPGFPPQSYDAAVGEINFAVREGERINGSLTMSVIVPGDTVNTSISISGQYSALFGDFFR